VETALHPARRRQRFHDSASRRHDDHDASVDGDGAQLRRRQRSHDVASAGAVNLTRGANEVPVGSGAVRSPDDPSSRRRQRFHAAAFVAVTAITTQALTAMALCPDDGSASTVGGRRRTARAT
jgi:hypothetical protein